MEQLGFEIFGRDRFSATTRAAGKSAKAVAADIEAANIRVEKSTKSLSVAELRYGKGSLQARDAANRLTKAQLGLDSANKQTERSQTRVGKSMDRFRTVAAVAGTVVGAALFKIGRDSVNIASSIVEGQNKVRVVFGASAGAVEDMAGRSAKALGISKLATLQAAGTFGNLFVSMKLPQPEAAKMSVRMVQLAADMASFNDSTPEEALAALKSGLVGETEPLRRFGVNLNDATIRQQALKLGLISTTKDALSPAVKAQATYALILNQTKTAQGDFARTSGSMANQLKQAKARFSDLQGELGTKLLPAVNGTLSGLLAMADFIGRNHRTIVPLVAIVGALATTIWTVNKAGKAWIATQAAWVTVGKAVTAVNVAQNISLGALARTAGKLIGVLGGVLVIWGEFERGAPQRAAKGLAQDFSGAGDATKRFLNWFSQLVGLTPKYTTEAMKQAAAVRATRAAYGDSRQAAITQMRAMNDGRTAAIGQTRAIAAQSEALRTHRRAVKLDANAILAASNTEIGWRQAIDDARTALRENGKTLDTNTQKGRNNRTALNSAAAAALAHRDALKENSASTRTQTRHTEQARAELVRMARRLGMNKEEARKYTNQILGIPKRHDTNVRAHTGDASRAIRDFKSRTNAQLNAINDERVRVIVSLPSAKMVSRNVGIGDGPGVAGRPTPIRLPRPSGPPIGDGFGVSLNTRAATPGPAAMRRFGASASRGMDAIADRYETRMNKYLQTKLNAMGGGTAAGWRRMWALVHRAFPGAALHSAYRPGAITATGNRSYHGMGRAIDVTPSMAIFNWIRSRYGRNTKELIYSPAGGRQVHNGRPHMYTGITRAMHFNHVHWAMRNGGTIREPVLGVGKSGATYSFGEGGRHEAVVPMQRGGAGSGGPVVHNHYHFPNYVGDKNDLVRALDDLRRTKRLPVAS